MKTIIAIGVSAAALVAASSVATAQTECVNGWMMIKDQILVRCDMLPSAFAGRPAVVEPDAVIYDEPGAVVYRDPGPVYDEPMFTGSIRTGVGLSNESEMPPRAGGPGNPVVFSASRAGCEPGQYWMLNSANRPVACY